MKINIIIDVIRAFTVAHIALIKGVEKIILVDSIADALMLKEKNPEYLLAGERQGIAITGFDLDNSPYSISKMDGLHKKTLVQTTTNGTRATLNNLDADRVFIVGYSNAKTLAHYVKSIHYDDINIIPSRMKDDDIAVANYIQAILDDKIDKNLEISTINTILDSDVARKFYNNTLFNAKDLNFCTTEISSNFVMEAVQENKNIKIIKRVI